MGLTFFYAHCSYFTRFHTTTMWLIILKDFLELKHITESLDYIPYWHWTVYF